MNPKTLLVWQALAYFTNQGMAVIPLEVVSATGFPWDHVTTILARLAMTGRASNAEGHYALDDDQLAMLATAEKAGRGAA